MKGKIGATEWTMSKLLTLVLGVLVLVLVIYGVSTNGFEPLKNKVMGAIDEVLILFGIKSAPPTSYDCTPRQLNLVPGGSSFLSTLKYPVTVDTKFQFTLCDGDCSVEGPKDFGKYYFDGDGWWGKKTDFYFKKRGTGENYFAYPVLLEDSYKSQTQEATEENIKQAEFYRKLYKKVTEEVITPTELDSIYSFFNKRYTKRILIWTNGDSEDYASYFLWQSGFVIYYAVNNALEHNLRPDYLIKKRNIRSIGFDFDSSLEVLIKRVSDGLKQEDVYHGIGNPWLIGENSEIISDTWSGIDKLAGRDGLRIDPFESELEIETDGEKQKLKGSLCRERAELMMETYPTEEEVDLLRGLRVLGSRFEFEGKTYEIDLWSSNYIKHDSFEKEALELCGRNLFNYPTISIQEVGTENYYGLTFTPVILETLFAGDDAPIETSLSPMMLTKLNSETKLWEPVGYQEDYKIKNDEDFVKLSNARRTKDFLLRTCRSVK